MPPPLVSILIPCHNAAAYLASTLESCLAQTCSPCEIIVVDDGSTDESREIAARYVNRGVLLLTQTKQGAASARNTAFRTARGTYLQYLDADDLLAPNKIAAQLERAVCEQSCAVLTGHWGRFESDPAFPTFTDSNPLFADLSSREYLLRYCSYDCMMHPAAWLVPRAIAIKAGPWDEQLSLNDDGEYFARIVAHAPSIIYCADAVSLYRSSLPGSLSQQRTPRHISSAYRALTQIVSVMLKLEDSQQMRRAAADLCQRFAYDYYPASTEYTLAAEFSARELGGSKYAPLGGSGFQVLRRLVGWKLARRLQIFAGKFPH